MEETRKYPPAAEHVSKYGLLLLAIILMVVIGVFTASTIPANAAQTAAASTDNQLDYAALYQEALGKIAEQEQVCANYTLELSELKALTVEQTNLLSEQEARITELTEALATAQQEKDAFITEYGTYYYVDYEIRHCNFLCPEAILRFQTIVPAETYSTLHIGQTLPVATVFHSIPSGSDLNKWTATVVDLRLDPIWEQTP